MRVSRAVLAVAVSFLLACGREEQPSSAACASGRCELRCAEGGCVQDCAPGTECSAVCPGGACIQTCLPGARCAFECRGGHCDQTCAEGAECDIDCEGGACQQHCVGETSCSVPPDCIGGSCSCSGAGCAGREPLPPTFEVDLSELTEHVVRWSAEERRRDEVYLEAGQIRVGEQLVQLHKIERNPCPDALLNCDESESSALGVGSSALLSGLSSIKGSIRDQGQRGTCVSFAINAAVEYLLSQRGISEDLSEQATYWYGHQLQGAWDSEGLQPAATVRGLTVAQVPLVPESAWPYNPDRQDCSRYALAHPEATCSESETQGGGADGSETPAELSGAGGVRIEAYRTVFASLGRLKLALYQGHPVVLGVDAELDFVLATRYGGVAAQVLAQSTCEDECGHAILALGYADDERIDGGGYVIVRNHWGSRWGDEGLGYLTYEWLEDNFLDATAVIAVRP